MQTFNLHNLPLSTVAAEMGCALPELRDLAAAAGVTLERVNRGFLVVDEVDAAAVPRLREALVVRRREQPEPVQPQKTTHINLRVEDADIGKLAVLFGLHPDIIRSTAAEMGIAVNGTMVKIEDFDRLSAELNARRQTARRPGQPPAWVRR